MTFDYDKITVETNDIKANGVGRPQSARRLLPVELLLGRLSLVSAGRTYSIDVIILITSLNNRLTGLKVVEDANGAVQAQAQAQVQVQVQVQPRSRLPAHSGPVPPSVQSFCNISGTERRSK